MDAITRQERSSPCSVLVLVSDLVPQLLREQQLRTDDHDLLAGREMARVEPTVADRVRGRYLPAHEQLVLVLRVRPGLAAVPNHRGGGHYHAVARLAPEADTAYDAHANAQALSACRIEVSRTAQRRVGTRCR